MISQSVKSFPDSELIDDLVTANHILFDQGVVDAFGHISVRSGVNKARFWLSRAIAPALVETADVMEFDLDGSPVDARDRRMYIERYIHSEIYRARPDVQAVLHSHSPTVIPFTVSSTPLRPVANVSGFLGAGPPIFEIRGMNADGDVTIVNPAQGRALAQTLAGNAVVLMRGHGVSAVGDSIRQAVWRGIYTEVAARQLIIALQLGGTPTYLDFEEQQYGLLQAPADKDRAWDLWRSKARRRGYPA